MGRGPGPRPAGRLGDTSGLREASRYRSACPSAWARFTWVRVAPDGVRIALIVGTGASAHMMVGAITRSGGAVFVTQAVTLAPGLPGPPTALTWYNEDHLLAITQFANGTRLWEVPVNGDLPIPKSPQPGMASITAASRRLSLRGVRRPAGEFGRSR